MQNIVHKINHTLQPTNNTCGYAALVTLFSHYDKNITVEEIVKLVSQPNDSTGTSHGSVTAQLADLSLKLGFNVNMYVSDMYVTDLSWQEYSSLQIKDRLRDINGKRKNPIIGDHWMSVYEDAYISYLENGGKLKIVQFITTDLIDNLLVNGPVYANICSSAHTGRGRTTSQEDQLRTDKQDDIKGTINTHSVVIYGFENGNYLLSDPWDGLTVCSPEKLVLAIEAAQIECDNQIFTITKS